MRTWVHTWCKGTQLVSRTEPGSPTWHPEPFPLHHIPLVTSYLELQTSKIIISLYFLFYLFLLWVSCIKRALCFPGLSTQGLCLLPGGLGWPHRKMPAICATRHTGGQHSAHSGLSWTTSGLVSNGCFCMGIINSYLAMKLRRATADWPDSESW